MAVAGGFRTKGEGRVNCGFGNGSEGGGESCDAGQSVSAGGANPPVCDSLLNSPRVGVHAHFVERFICINLRFCPPYRGRCHIASVAVQCGHLRALPCHAFDVSLVINSQNQRLSSSVVPIPDDVVRGVHLVIVQLGYRLRQVDRDYARLVEGVVCGFDTWW
ncbi:hypothetical protein GW17_00051221 [Ensete ventricosum]|nr:hypothetical protein GW17_00051221 [Ensete ventricosum]